MSEALLTRTRTRCVGGTAQKFVFVTLSDIADPQTGWAEFDCGDLIDVVEQTFEEISDTLDKLHLCGFIASGHFIDDSVYRCRVLAGGDI